MQSPETQRDIAPEGDSAPSTTTSPWRRSLGRLLVVAGLCGLAVAQPVLDLLGDNPTAFQFREVEGLQIALFAVVVVVVPPVLLWLVGEAVRGVDRRAGRVVHLATAGVLIGMVGVLLSKGVVENEAVAWTVAVAVAVGGTLAYMRVDGVALWLRLLSVANVLFLAQFLFMAPVSDWITDDTQTAADVTFAPEAAGALGQPASVVMVVLDELATQSVLTEDETIDAVRFPNLAGFGEGATWYRHFSTVSPFTQSAVPALLDGRDPSGEPVWTDHPDNLFSLLANSHHLTVSESLTKLCGFEVCRGGPKPPPDSSGGATADPGGSSPQWGALLRDTREIWIERVTPGVTSGESFADFAEEVEAGDSPESEAEEAPPELDGNGEVVPIDEDQLLEGYFATGIEAQPTRLAEFVDALQPTDDPFFAYLHLLCPISPGWPVRTARPTTCPVTPTTSPTSAHRGGPGSPASASSSRPSTATGCWAWSWTACVRSTNTTTP